MKESVFLEGIKDPLRKKIKETEIELLNEVYDKGNLPLKTKIFSIEDIDEEAGIVTLKGGNVSVGGLHTKYDSVIDVPLEMTVKILAHTIKTQGNDLGVIGILIATEAWALDVSPGKDGYPEDEEAFKQQIEEELELYSSLEHHPKSKDCLTFTAETRDECYLSSYIIEYNEDGTIKNAVRDSSSRGWFPKETSGLMNHNGNLNNLIPSYDGIYKKFGIVKD